MQAYVGLRTVHSPVAMNTDGKLGLLHLQNSICSISRIMMKRAEVTLTGDEGNQQNQQFGIKECNMNLHAKMNWKKRGE